MTKIVDAAFSHGCLVFAFIACSLLFCAGCAFSDLQITPPAPAEVAAASKIGRGRQVFVQFPFADDRPDRSRCGMRKNSYNMDTADVECTVSPGQWVAQALAQGLAAAGFQVITSNPAPTRSSVTIQGTVLQLFVEPKIEAFTFNPEADISVKLVVTSPSGLHAERVFYFKAEEVSVFGTESNFQAAAQAATQVAVQGMVTAIVSLLDRFPELGVPDAVPLALAQEATP